MVFDEVLSIKNGSRISFKKAFVAHSQKLHNFISKKTGSDFIADEVVQLVYIRIWEHREKLNEQLSLEIQLFHLSKNIMVDELRKEAVRRKYAESMVTGHQASFETQLEAKESLKKLSEAVNNLTPTQKTVFNLSRTNGLSHKEIAEILTISPKTVENHIAQALKYLKSAILVYLLVNL